MKENSLININLCNEKEQRAVKSAIFANNMDIS